MPAHLLPSQSNAQSSARATKAPWIETGFVQIPIEFFANAVKSLSKGAQRVYFLHCKHARTKGEGAGFSYAYRETLARELGCSLSTVDRANAELEQRHLIRDVGRRFQHGGAVVFQLLSPSKWCFDARKNAPLTQQKCALEDAKTRPITKDKKQLKPKEQQTALRSFSAQAPVVVDSTKVEEAASPSLPPETQMVCAQLEAQGITATLAVALVTRHGERECAYQVARLGRQKAVRNRAAWLSSALVRGDRDATPSDAAPVPAPLPKKEPSPEEAALQRVRELAKQKECHEVAEQVLATLDARRQAYILRCVELEKTTLERVIERDEHYAFGLELRRRT